MLDVLDSLILDDGNEYLVTSKVDNLDDNVYYYLADINNIENFKYGIVEDDAFFQINEPELFKKLLPLFTNNCLKNIPKDLFDEFEE